MNYRKNKFVAIILFCFLLIAIGLRITFIGYNDLVGECSNCDKKEGMTNANEIISGRMAGTIRHAMSPAISSTKRQVRTTITNAFSNPEMEYYTNKLQQIFE